MVLSTLSCHFSNVCKLKWASLNLFLIFLKCELRGSIWYRIWNRIRYMNFCFLFDRYHLFTACCLWGPETTCRVNSIGAAVSPSRSRRVVAPAITASPPIASPKTRSSCVDGSANCLSAPQLCVSTAGAWRSRRPALRTVPPGNALPPPLRFPLPLPLPLPLTALHSEPECPRAYRGPLHRRWSRQLARRAARCALCARSATACGRHATRAPSTWTTTSRSASTPPWRSTSTTLVKRSPTSPETVSSTRFYLQQILIRISCYRQRIYSRVGKI